MEETHDINLENPLLKSEQLEVVKFINTRNLVATDKSRFCKTKAILKPLYD